jgi:WD40 repeat protein
MSDLKKIDPTKTREALQHKHSRPLVACRFHPTGRFVFLGAEDNLVHRFDIQSKAITPFAGHDSWVRAIGFSPDGKLLYTAGYDGRLVFWPAAADKPQPIQVIDAHHGWVRALAVSPDGKQVATCGNDQLVKLWNTANGELIEELAVHGSQIYNIAFSPSGASLVWCDLKGVVQEYDVATEDVRKLGPAEKLYKYDPSFRADIGGARSIAFSADGKRLALGGITNVTNAFAGIGNAIVVLIDIESGKVIQQLEAKDKVNGTAWGVAHHPGVAVGAEGHPSSTASAPFWIGLAGGGGGGWLYFWKDERAAAEKEKSAKDAVLNEFFKLKLPTDGRDLSLSPDKTQVAVAHSDGALRLFALHER